MGLALPCMRVGAVTPRLAEAPAREGLRSNKTFQHPNAARSNARLKLCMRYFLFQAWRCTSPLPRCCPCPHRGQAYQACGAARRSLPPFLLPTTAGTFSKGSKNKTDCEVSSCIAQSGMGNAGGNCNPLSRVTRCPSSCPATAISNGTIETI
jgi:hypothetical protein